MDWIDILIKATPGWLGAFVDIVIKATPQFGAVVSVVTAPWFLGLLGGGFLAWAWKELA